MMLLHLPHEARKSLFVAFEACIHASEGAQVSHDYVGFIEILFVSKCFWWDLHQLVSPGRVGLDIETLLGVNWGQWFHVFFVITFYHHDALVPFPGS